jgi:CubicO group peptidase (beta-lactamase class C family)
MATDPPRPAQRATSLHPCAPARIRDNWNLLIASYVEGDSPMELRTFLRRYLFTGGADFAPNNFYSFGPGRYYRYANVGADLAAFLVEAAAGIGFDTWCEQRIFAPLGMDRAEWHLAGLPLREIAMPYTWSGNKNAYVPTGHYGYPDYPDGALRTTAPQLARHLAMVMGGGSWRDRRLLSEATVRELRRDQVPGPRAGARPDLVPSAPRRSASSIRARTWAWWRSRTAAGDCPVATTGCT